MNIKVFENKDELGTKLYPLCSFITFFMDKNDRGAYGCISISNLYDAFKKEIPRDLIERKFKKLLVSKDYTNLFSYERAREIRIGEYMLLGLALKHNNFRYNKKTDKLESEINAI